MDYSILMYWTSPFNILGVAGVLFSFKNWLLIFFFSFPWGMNEIIDVLMYDWRSPPYENVHVGFFIHTSRKRKKKTQLSILII